MEGQLRRVETPELEQALLEYGDRDGWPVILLHGFPYDASAYADAAPILAGQGAYVIVPYLRGYGATTFRSADTIRSGQQAALAADLLALMDALNIRSAFLAGYDWGGRAACIVSALWPERVNGLVSVNGYNMQDIARAGEPALPEAEYRHWYQFYLHGERGRAGLRKHTAEFCRQLWRLWSPTWRFSEEIFARTASSFANPDFVEVVVHSYRHRYGLAAGDQRYEDVERRIASRPPIDVSTIVLDGAVDGVAPPKPPDGALFSDLVMYGMLPDVGHNVPQEAPDAFAQAVMAVRERSANR